VPDNKADVVPCERLPKLIQKTEGGIPLAIVVEVQEDNLEKALRTLKKKMQLDGLQRELKNRRFYEKPSVKRRRKMQDAERRRRKARRRRV
jgi:small subunit ribosomal protein S21